MPPRRRGPVCSESNIDLCLTPGTLSVRDAWDPSRPNAQVNRRRPGGAIRLAEEGEIVLADARQPLTLPVVKVKEPKHAHGPGHAVPGAPPIDLPTKNLMEPFTKDPLRAVDVEQGDIGDCVLPAVLAAMAHTTVGRQKIRKMIRMNKTVMVRSEGNGKVWVTRGLVTVTFPGRTGQVSISRLLYREGNRLTYSRSRKKNAGWVSFIEKAYAVKLGNDYARLRNIDHGTVFKDLIGKPPEQIRLRKAEGGPLLLKRTDYIRKMLNEATRFPTIATTPKGKGGFNTPHGADIGLMANHGLAVLGMHTKGKMNYVLLAIEGSVMAFPFADFLKDIDYVARVKD